MACPLGDTTLGRLFALSSKSTKSDAESGPSGWLPSQAYDLSLKLESARIPATFGHAREDAMETLEKAPDKTSLSDASTWSEDTKTNLEQLADAECLIGWNGVDDPEVR